MSLGPSGTVSPLPRRRRMAPSGAKAGPFGRASHVRDDKGLPSKRGLADVHSELWSDEPGCTVDDAAHALSVVHTNDATVSSTDDQATAAAVRKSSNFLAATYGSRRDSLNSRCWLSPEASCWASARLPGSLFTRSPSVADQTADVHDMSVSCTEVLGFCCGMIDQESRQPPVTLAHHRANVAGTGCQHSPGPTQGSAGCRRPAANAPSAIQRTSRLGRRGGHSGLRGYWA